MADFTGSNPTLEYTWRVVLKIVLSAVLPSIVSLAANANKATFEEVIQPCSGKMLPPWGYTTLIFINREIYGFGYNCNRVVEMNSD